MVALTTVFLLIIGYLCASVVSECGHVPEEDNLSAADNKVTSFPWHANIYLKDNNTNEWKYRCMGTLVSKKVVLSTAHCFRDAFEISVQPEDLKIVFGKKYRALEDKRDSEQNVRIYRIRTLSGIYEHPEYEGRLGKYENDLTALVLDEKEVDINPTAQPVCLDFSESGREEPLPGTIGETPGRFKMTTEGLSDEMTIEKVPYISREDCTNTTSKYLDQFQPFVTKDKICGGEFGKFDKGKETCVGNSGGGYVFKDQKTGKYYLRGIVSSGDRHCQGLTLFTDIASHHPEIKKLTESSNRD